MSDRYEIQEKIGQGGIGAVYQAYDTQLKRSVAIKRMLPSEDEFNGQDAAELMLKEATTLSALQHPNIITVYDVGIDSEGPFVVMELLKGETLDEVIKRGVLTLRDFGEVVSQTMEALIAAEAAGVLHRDLKPTNVMVSWLPSKKFQVKILDFSLAKFSRKPSPQTIDQGDAIFGSIYFMAPEQFERGNLDQRTDLYSMGCLYYFCLSGRYPFQGETAAQVMASHLQGTVTSLDKIRADLPQVISQWVMWLINRDAANRPQDAREAFENYNEIAQSIDLETGRVNLSGAPVAPVVNTTSRRLIVPPPKKTTTVTALPPSVEGAGRREGTRRVGEVTGSETVMGMTAPVTVMKRKGGGTLVYLGIAIAILFLVAAGLGIHLWLGHYQSEKEVQRFKTLAGQMEPVGTKEDVAIIVAYLNRIDQLGVAAKVTLKRLQDVPGAEGEIDLALIESLKRAREPRVQGNLLEVMQLRSLHPEESLLLGMTSRDYDPGVTVKAMLLLGDFGDRQVFEKLLETFRGQGESNVPPGVPRALELIGQRLGQADREAAAAAVADKLVEKTGTIRFPLLRTLGSLGGRKALQVLGETLTQPGDSEGAVNDRRTALAALALWPQRSEEVAELIRAVWQGDDRQLALDAYLKLAMRPAQAGAPSQDVMVQDLWTQLRTDRDEGELNIVRLDLIAQLPLLEDRDFAREIAGQMEESRLLHRGVRETAKKVRLELGR